MIRQALLSCLPRYVSYVFSLLSNTYTKSSSKFFWGDGGIMWKNPGNCTNALALIRDVNFCSFRNSYQTSKENRVWGKSKKFINCDSFSNHVWQPSTEQRTANIYQTTYPAWFHWFWCKPFKYIDHSGRRTLLNNSLLFGGTLLCKWMHYAELR